MSQSTNISADSARGQVQISESGALESTNISTDLAPLQTEYLKLREMFEEGDVTW